MFNRFGFIIAICLSAYANLLIVWFNQDLDPVQVATKLVEVIFLGLASIAFAVIKAKNEK